MSGPIRSILGLTKHRLQRYLDEVVDRHPFIDATADAVQNISALRGIRTNYVFQRDRMEKAIGLLEKQNLQWSTLLSQLEDDALETEEELYKETAEGADGFVTKWTEAEDRVSTINGWLSEIEELIGEMNELRQIQQQSNAGNAATSSNNGGYANPQAPPISVRLPKLDMTPFHGNPLHWSGWWDQYSASVHQQNIAPIQKFTYLKTVLRGSAAAAIDGITINSVNYEQAIELLKKRFGDKSQIKEILYANLRKLPAVRQLQATELRRFMDELEKILRQLEAQQEDVCQHSLTGLKIGRAHV